MATDKPENVSFDRVLSIVLNALENGVLDGKPTQEANTFVDDYQTALRIVGFLVQRVAELEGVSEADVVASISKWTDGSE